MEQGHCGCCESVVGKKIEGKSRVNLDKPEWGQTREEEKAMTLYDEIECEGYPDPRRGSGQEGLKGE
jgi:hypothetical protein